MCYHQQRKSSAKLVAGNTETKQTIQQGKFSYIGSQRTVHRSQNLTEQ